MDHRFHWIGAQGTGPETPVSSVLVTGAAGGLGRTICRIFAEEGLRVRALIRPEDDLRLVPLDCAAIKVGYVQNADDVAAATTGVDTIINCAALLPNALHLGAKALFDVNVGGAVTVFQAAIAQNVRTAVFFSTISVVDHNNRTVHRDELLDFVHDPGDAYLASKIELERALLRMRSAYGGHLAIVRPAFIYGPGNYAVWKEALRLATQGKMVLIGNGQAALPLIYAEDLARYVLALMRGPKFDPPYDIHVVANAEPTSMEDVFEFIADYLGGKYPRKVPSSLARLGAMMASRIPETLRVGPLKLLTPARVTQYSRGYDLSRVLDHPLLNQVSMTSYDLGLSRMLDDYLKQR
jgi:nucleoside-diphosphate-sugar epimerase